MKKLIYFSILTVAFLCVTLILLAPYLLHLKSKYGFLIYFIFSPLCHQISERSFHLFSSPLAVCSRCTGIYFGLLIGIILYPFFTSLKNLNLPSSKIFVLFSLPMGGDVFGNILSLWTSPNLIRFLTGIIFGIILPFYLIPGIMDLVRASLKINSNLMKIRNENKKLENV